MNFSDILPPRSWRRRLAIAATVLLVLYGVVGFFVVPTIARPRLEAVLADALGRPVTIGGLRFNPFAVSVSLRDFRLDDDKGEPLIAAAELYGDLSVLSLLRLAVTLDSVHLLKPHVRLVLDKKGNLNLADLFASAETEEEPPTEETTDDGLFPVNIGSVTIAGGHLLFRDEGPAQPFEIELQPIELELLDFSTRRDRTGRHVISATTGNEGTLHWTGNVSIDPLYAEGEIALDKIKVTTFASYGEGTPLLAVNQGLVALKTKYVFDDRTGAGAFALGPADLDVATLELREGKDSPPFVVLPQLRVTGINVDFDKSKVSIASVSSKKARFQAWLGADGAMGPTAVFGDPGATESAETNEDAEEGTAWSVSIARIDISDYGVALEDRSLPQPFAFAVEPIEIKVKDLSLDAGAKAGVEVKLGLPDEAAIEAAGSLGLSPLAVDLKVRVDDIALGRFQPYVSRAARLDIDSGSAAIDGQLKVYSEDGGPTVIEYGGAATVRDLATSDTVREEELIKWTSLQLNGIAYVSHPASLRIAEAVVDEPYARILIGKEGNLNLADLGVEAAEVEPPATANDSGGSEDDGDALAIAIDAFRVNEGQTDFADFSIEPNVSTGIFSLNGEVLQLSSDPKAKSKVALEGKVDKRSPVKITGTINPFNPATQTDIDVSFENVSLTIFTPYSARFAGYRIKKGKASLALNYHVEDGRLKAENEVVLDQLTLGERVQSAEATGLPVSLAVALLKDRNGRITLNLPVRGNLDDPKFSFSRILVNALLDLIKKTAASPFSILGSLTDFDSDELKYVEFAPGSATLDDEEAKKLDAISEALKERPALRLEVSGGVDRLADAVALGQVELTKALKRAKRARLKAEGLPAPKKLSAIELSADEYEQLFAEKYSEQFGARPPRDEQGNVTAAARQALAGSFEIDDNDLRNLAKKRAAAIHDRITENGVEEQRVYLVESDLLRTKEQGEIRSELSLTS